MDEDSTSTHSTPRKTVSPVWNHFTAGARKGHFYEATCNHCGAQFTWGKAGEMEKHLRNKCPGCPAEVREEFMKTIHARAKSTPRNRAPADDEVEKETNVLPENTKRHQIWHHYELGRKKGKCFEVTCRYCGSFYNWGKAGQMVNHILRLCKQAPEEVKAEFMDYPTSQTACRKRSSCDLDDAVDGIIEDEENGDGIKYEQVAEVEEGAEVPASEASATEVTGEAVYEFEPEAAAATATSSASEKNPYWDHFTPGRQFKKFYAATCKYCNEHFRRGVPTQFRMHLAKFCPSVPPEVKAEYAEGGPLTDLGLTVVHDGDAKAASFTNTPSASARVTRRSVLATVTTPRARNFAEILLSSARRSKSGNSIANSIALASAQANKRRKISESVVVIATTHEGEIPTELPQTQYDSINQALTKLMICCGLPVVTLEHPAFTQLLRTLNPLYLTPSVSSFTENLNEEIHRANDQIREELKRSPFLTISISAQHGKSDTVIVYSATGARVGDGTRRSYFIKAEEAVPIQRSMLPQLAAAELVGESKTALMAFNVGESLVQIASEVGENKVAAVVCHESLSAAIAPEKISQKILKVPCVLTMFQTMEMLLTSEPVAQEFALICDEILNVAGNERLSERFHTNQQGLFLTTIQEALRNKEAVWPLTDAHRSDNWDRVTSRLSDDLRIRRKVDSEDFWTELQFLADLTRPLYDMWESYRKQTMTMGDVYYSMLSVAAKVAQAPPLMDELVPHFAAGAIRELLKLDTIPIFRIVYILHPLYRGQGLRNILSEEVLLETGKISKLLVRTAEQTQGFLKQLKKFVTAQAPFDKPFHFSDSPVSFWERLPLSAGVELKQVATRLLSIYPVSQLPLPFARASLASSHSMVETIGKLCGFYHTNADDEFPDAQPVAGDQNLTEKLLSLDPHFHSDFVGQDASVAATVEEYRRLNVLDDPIESLVSEIFDPSLAIFERKPSYWTSTNTGSTGSGKTAQPASEECDVRELVLMELTEE